jgi:hypothetical protein
MADSSVDPFSFVRGVAGAIRAAAEATCGSTRMPLRALGATLGRNRR